MSHDTNDRGDSEPTKRAGDTEAKPVTVREDWKRSGQPIVTLVEAVAAATDRTATDLPPLQQSVDTDALDTLLTQGESAVTVTFTYADVGVTVSGNGTVEIQVDEPDTERARE